MFGSGPFTELKLWKPLIIATRFSDRKERGRSRTRPTSGLAPDVGGRFGDLEIRTFPLPPDAEGSTGLPRGSRTFPERLTVPRRRTSFPKYKSESLRFGSDNFTYENDVNASEIQSSDRGLVCCWNAIPLPVYLPFHFSFSFMWIETRRKLSLRLHREGFPLRGVTGPALDGHSSREYALVCGRFAVHCTRNRFDSTVQPPRNCLQCRDQTAVCNDKAS